jgi:hypothetical protein
MRTVKNDAWTVTAILAIIGGLGIAAASWGDGHGGTSYVYPPSVGPTSTTALCYAQAGMCGDWDGNCHNRGDLGYTDSLFTCGNTVWLSLQEDDFRSWGLCQGSTGTCTKWQQFFCLHYNVYKDACGISPASLACDWFYWVGGLCDPNAPS